MEDIKKSANEKAGQLRQEFTKAQRRLGKWPEIKDSIASILNDFSRYSHGLDCYVQKDMLEEEEFVHLYLKRQAPWRNFKKYRSGGCLCYNLTHRGKIVVFIVDPFAVGENDEKEIRLAHVLNNASYEPEDITASLIYEHLNKFLEMMLKWETSNEVPIGFRQVPYVKPE